MNPYEFYDAGYLAGIEGNDACPHLPFTLPWVWWQCGHFVGHHTLCSQLEATVLFFPQD
ncbi:hypothetical protein ACFLEY_22315 [Bradyrhizobium sp. YCK136]|uniref:Uncharacterized protein n=1 Tax=Bradyrhizobium diazoefficiens TaxID=1355477 RepID=A0A0E4FY31_9BRAD|nr:hypothetical protein NK6_8775 [Bradyrhizobium diazoefficiens]BCF44086.1 hypothetical protein XF16B_45760 [Bradyrhizobium diazoefficiens]BCF70229.1 hypothetical protein XF19B_45820 [Bradyrhizobium diazoefficiens]